jgi:tellurite resistance protein TehA-like permease
MWLWRHWSRGVRLAYEPALWSLIFPLGMYVATIVELGRALDQSWLVTVARLALPVTTGAWLWTFAAMAWSWRRVRSELTLTLLGELNSIAACFVNSGSAFRVRISCRGCW